MAPHWSCSPLSTTQRFQVYDCGLALGKEQTWICQALEWPEAPIPDRNHDKPRTSPLC